MHPALKFIQADNMLPLGSHGPVLLTVIGSDYGMDK